MEDEVVLIIIYIPYIISTCIFFIFLCNFLLEIFTEKTNTEKSRDKGLYISSLIQNIFACIIYSEYIEGYTLIPVVIIAVSAIIRLTKHKGIANALCLSSSIVFIFLTILLGGEMLIEDTGITKEPPLYKDEYYITHDTSGFFSSNQLFTQYEGYKLTGPQVKQLIQGVIEHNSYLREERGKVRLTLNGDIIVDGKEKIMDFKLSDLKKYKVSFEYDEEGLICLGKIEEVEDTNNNTVNEVK